MSIFGRIRGTVERIAFKLYVVSAILTLFTSYMWGELWHLIRKD